MGFQVIAGTSIPVVNSILGMFGAERKLAPPTDAVAFYSKFQIWFAIAIGILSAIGQFFWWKKIDRKILFNQLFIPVVAAVLVTLLVVNLLKVFNISYILLMLAGFFTIFANAKILVSLLKSSPGLSGGAIAHIGVGLMLIGVMFSAGYSKVVSLNNTGLQISKEFSKEFNRDNLLLFVHEPRTMWGFEIEYLGERLQPRYHSGFIRTSDIHKTGDKNLVIAKRDISVNGRNYKTNDSIRIEGENTFYEIELRKGEKKYTLHPRAQINPEMGGLLASPDIYRTVTADLYTHVSSVMNPTEEEEWSKMEEVKVKQAQEFFANDYVTVLESVDRIFNVLGLELTDQDVAVKAKVRLQGEKGEYLAEPIFLIRDKLAGRIADEIKDLGVRVTLLNIHPETSEFTIGIETRQKDWVVIKALEKPYINLLWIGTFVLLVGFSVAMTRRVREFKKMKQKGLE
jgi:cytochrome c-type biogenesis protein CcmF